MRIILDKSFPSIQTQHINCLEYFCTLQFFAATQCLNVDPKTKGEKKTGKQNDFTQTSFALVPFLFRMVPWQHTKACVKKRQQPYLLYASINSSLLISADDDTVRPEGLE
jgi:hypothetical protein